VTGLILAEVRKLRTTQVWFWLLLAGLALTAVGVLGQILGSSDADLATGPRDVITTAGSANVVVFVLGVLSVTTEFRYQTITPTVLTTPSRWRLITAKLITYAVVGALFAAACLLLALAMALPWLHARGVDIPASETGKAIAAVVLELALSALLGLGMGALLKNQIVAVSVGLVLILVVQNLVIVIPGIKYAYPYLPAGAANAMVTSRAENRVLNGVHLLPPWAGALVFALWGIGLALLGAGITMRRDIT
jgi:ABC-2 type transport system permease protein